MYNYTGIYLLTCIDIVEPHKDYTRPHTAKDA